MKHFLFSGRLDVATTLASTVGSPSVHRRGTMLKPLFLAMLFLIAGIGNVSADTEAALSISSKPSSSSETLTDDQSNEWAFTSDGTVSGSETNLIHVGTNSSQVSYVQLVSTGLSSNSISEIHVWAAAKASTNVTIKIYIGENLLGTSSVLGNTSSSGGTEFSVNNTNNYSGEVKILVSRPSKANGAIYFNSATVTYTTGGGGSTNPTVSVDPASWNFGTVHASDAASKVFSVSGSNLTEGTLTLTVPTGFSVSPTSIAVNGTLAATNVTVSKNTSTEDDYAGNLTISGGGQATAKTVALTMTVDADPEPTGIFNKYTGTTLPDGYYVICSGTSTTAMKNAATSAPRIDVATVDITNETTITDPDESVIWKLENLTGDDAGYFTLYNEAAEKYAAFTSGDGKGTVIASVTDYAKFNHVTSSTYEFQNKGKTGKNLRYNNTYGFASYSTSTGAALTLYKKAVSSAVTISAPEHTTLTVKNSSNVAVASGASIAEGARLYVGATSNDATAYRVAAKAYKTGDESTVVTIDATDSITMPGYPITITADETTLFAVNVAVNDNNMGSATMDGGTATVYKANNETVTLVATPESGHEFVNWTAITGITFDDATKANGAIATITAAGTITANFQVQGCTGLAAPTLNEVTKTYNSATIAWNTVANADSYSVNVVNHSTSASVFNGSVDALSKELTGLAANTQYDYTVMAIGDGTSYCDENNPTLAGNFTTDDYPAATLSLVENGGEPYNLAGSHKLNDVVTLPSSLQGSGCTDKVLVGWSSVSVAETNTKPASNYWDAGAEYSLSATSQTLYAVLATAEEGDPTTWTIESSDLEILDNDQSSTYNKYKGNQTKGGITYNIADVMPATGANSGKIQLKGSTGTIYNTTAFAADIVSVVVTDVDVAVYEGDSEISSTPNSGNINATGSGPYTYTFSSGKRFFHLKKSTSGAGYVTSITVNLKGENSYEGYTTSCTAANPKVATPVISGVENNETYTTGKTITLTCGTEDATIYYSLDGADAVAYTEAFSVGTYGTHTITAYATKADYDDSGEASVSFTLNLPFASLAELVAANVASGTEVTVTFNELISGIYSNSQSKKKGIYLTTLAANDKAIEIYYNQGSEVVPSSWAIGGQVVATAMTFTWTYYSGGTQWELVPLGNEWTWENGDLSYTAPKAVSSIAIKAGSVPTQTTYADGGTFNPTGMTVTFTYTDETTKDITSADPEWAAIEWTFDPETLSEGNETVSVTATYNEIASAAFEVSGITVTGIPTKTTAEFIAAGGVRCYLVGIVGEIKNSTYGNFDLTDAYGSIYVYGCLNANGEAQKFGDCGVVEGDKIKVLAETYASYGNPAKDEAVNVRFVEIMPQSVESVSLDEDAKTIKAGESFTLTATFTPTGATNKNVTWSTSDNTVATVMNGEVTGVKAGSATITVTTEDGNFTATCAVTVSAAYTVMYNTSGSTGEKPVDANTYVAGDEVTLASASGLSNAGHFFDQWVVTYVDGESETQTVAVEDGKFVMPAANVTATATWARKSSDKWIKVNATSELEAGEEYIIVNEDATYAMGEQKTNNRGAAEIDENNGVVTISTAVKLFTLSIPEANKYSFLNNGKYLYASSSSKNYLNEQATNDANGVWTISISEGVATITATGTNSHNVMRYNPNNGSPLFSCYASSSTTGTLVAIYKKAPVERIEDGQSVDISAIEENADVIVEDGGVLTVDADKQIGDLTVENGGKVVLSANKLTVVGTFSIETTMASGESGQLTGATASNFEAQQEAYIDITLGAGATSAQWHAFTVPFPVDVTTGVFDLDGNKLMNETNYAIMEYHGDVRATGAYGWKKISTTLVPGTFYLMTVDGARTTYRFKKKAGEPIVAGNSKAYTAYSGGGESTDQGWNGLGNPTLTYGKVALAVQVLDPTSYTYVTKTANSTNFVVGTPFFYQAAADGSMVMAVADAGANYAPARYTAQNEIKDLKVSFGNETFTDNLYISANEDALNEYEVGKDLVKMTMTKTPKVAQIFGSAYGYKLSMVLTPLVNNNAEVALELYAPNAGEYRIAAEEADGYTVYLTREGSIIWNLSAGAYTSEFTKGYNAGYGLLLQAKAPQTPTGVDNVQSDHIQSTKVLMDGNLYILRGEKLYDATGRIVK